MSICLDCTLERKYASWAGYKDLKQCKCMLCRDSLWKPRLAVEIEGIFADTACRLWKHLTADEQSGRRSDTPYCPKDYFEYAIQPYGTVIKTSSTVKGGLCTWVRVTDQATLHRLFEFQKLFPGQGSGSFRCLPTGEVAGVVPPVTFKHTTLANNIQRLFFTYQVAVFNSKGRVKLATDFPMDPVADWGKHEGFSPKAYLQSVLSQMPEQLVQRGCRVLPAVSNRACALRREAFKTREQAAYDAVPPEIQRLMTRTMAIVERNKTAAAEERKRKAAALDVAGGKLFFLTVANVSVAGEHSLCGTSRCLPPSPWKLQFAKVVSSHPWTCC